MIETSAETGKLDAALAKAQGEIEAASKDAKNPAFKSRYADLTAVWTACRPALAKHGISLTQWPVHGDDGRLHIITRIAHGGEWLKAHFSIPVTKQDPQGYGSAITYADEDDDGNAASGRNTYQAAAPARMPETPRVVESVGETYVRKFNEAETAEAFEDEVTKARAAWSRLNATDKAKVANSIEARRAFWAQPPAVEAAE